MIDVDFEHWRYEFPDDLLVKYGSPYFSESDAGKAYGHDIADHADKLVGTSLGFSELQILAGNEAFPENAVADPIADLEVWDEWKQGTRSFPYPGRYSKLGITRQEQKTSSPASVGVLGEIMAGYFAQCGVSPWILVRVVRQWPDFIFADRNRTYSFVESKAFSTEASGGSGLRARMLASQLADGANHAAQQLNSDAFGKVWYCITQIRSVSPLKLAVTFLELTVSDARRAVQTVRQMPAVVADGLAERALNEAAAKVGLVDDRDTFARFKSDEGGTKASLTEAVKFELVQMLSDMGDARPTEADLNVANEAVDKLLKTLVQRVGLVRSQPEQSGRRFYAAKEIAAQYRLSQLRGSGERSVFLADLPPDALAAIRRQWSPSWGMANRPWSTIGETPLWRCGGAVICVGPENLNGRGVTGVEQPA